MSGSDYASRAVEHNRAIAQAADEIMLLNIVRASQNRPVVYSQFSGVSENFSNSSGASIALPFGPDAASAYGLGLDIGPEQFASLSTAPLDDVDFYQGVMRPIQVGLIGYYLSNGWPPDLLLSLAVEKLTIGRDFYDRVVSRSEALCGAGHAPGACSRLDPAIPRTEAAAVAGGSLEFVNDPRSPTLFGPYHDLALRLVVLGLTVDGTFVNRETELPASAELVTDADQLQKLNTIGARVSREGGRIKVTTSTWLPTFRLARLEDGNLKASGERSARHVDLEISLRSPDSILFYVGVYTRPGGPDTRVLVGSAGRERYVSVLNVNDCDDAVVTVDFEGRCYGIPRDGDHMSMKVLAFLHQVFGLNKRAVDPPSIGAVKVVN